MSNIDGHKSTALCSKTHDHIFDDKLIYNWPLTMIFGTVITKTIGHRQVFLFSHLTYFVPLLYLENLSRPKSVKTKLNKMMKILHEDTVLIENFSVKKVWCTKAVEWISRQQGLETSNLEASTVRWRESGIGCNCPATRQWQTAWAFGAYSDDKTEKVEDFVAVRA